MRLFLLLVLVCVPAFAFPCLAQLDTPAPSELPVQYARDVPLSGERPPTVSITCATPGPVCVHTEHPHHPILVLLTMGDPERVRPLAEALTSTYAVVTPDLRGLDLAAARERIASVMDRIEDTDLGPCCTTNVGVAAIVAMADAAELGLSLLETMGCHVHPARRVVLVAPRDTVFSRIEACSQFSGEGSLMPIVIDPRGDRCDDSDDVISDTLGSGRVLEIDGYGTLCDFDATAPSVCECETRVRADATRLLARFVVDALDETPRAEPDSGRARLEGEWERRRVAIIEHVPRARARVGVAFSAVGGSGFGVRDGASGRDAHRNVTALGVRLELTFGRAARNEVGFGLYGDLGSVDIIDTRDVCLGIGAQLVLPTRRSRALVPSIGAHNRFFGPGPGITAGFFFGQRLVGHLEFPIGVRFDARFSVTDLHDHAFVLSMQMDLIGGLAMIGTAL